MLLCGDAKRRDVRERDAVGEIPIRPTRAHSSKSVDTILLE